MSQLVLIIMCVVCAIGCLAALISVTSSLRANIRRASQVTPFLAPLPGTSYDGEHTTIPFGLIQVQRLATPPTSYDEELEIALKNVDRKPTRRIRKA